MQRTIEDEASPQSAPARKKRIPVCFRITSPPPSLRLLMGATRKPVGRVESQR
jgi:hypothetical protein